MEDKYIDEDDMSQFYARRNSNSGSGFGISVEEDSEDVALPFVTPQSVSETAKPERVGSIVGFLFSVSREEKGEYWTLKPGVNTIGKSEECDVCLHEDTIANIHAQMKIDTAGGKLAVTLTDMQSGKKTLQNGLEITSGECYDHDIITVGDNYELLLILADRYKYCLDKREGFLYTGNSDDEPNDADDTTLGVGVGNTNVDFDSELTKF